MGVYNVIKPVRMSEAQRDFYAASAIRAGERFSTWARGAMDMRAARESNLKVSVQAEKPAGGDDVRGPARDARDGTAQADPYVGLPGPIREDGPASPPADHHPDCICRACKPDNVKAV